MSQAKLYSINNRLSWCAGGYPTDWGRLSVLSDWLGSYRDDTFKSVAQYFATPIMFATFIKNGVSQMNKQKVQLWSSLKRVVHICQAVRNGRMSVRLNQMCNKFMFCIRQISQTRFKTLPVVYTHGTCNAPFTTNDKGLRSTCQCIPIPPWERDMRGRQNCEYNTTSRKASTKSNA